MNLGCNQGVVVIGNWNARPAPAGLIQISLIVTQSSLKLSMGRSISETLTVPFPSPLLCEQPPTKAAQVTRALTLASVRMAMRVFSVLIRFGL